MLTSSCSCDGRFRDLDPFCAPSRKLLAHTIRPARPSGSFNANISPASRACQSYAGPISRCPHPGSPDAERITNRRTSRAHPIRISGRFGGVGQATDLCRQLKWQIPRADVKIGGTFGHGRRKWLTTNVVPSRTATSAPCEIVSRMLSERKHFTSPLCPSEKHLCGPLTLI